MGLKSQPMELMGPMPLMSEEAGSHTVIWEAHSPALHTLIAGQAVQVGG